MQDEIIRSVGEGRDTLALLPTGGGKSITYQVPALAKEGLALVITPLISLMTDQVDRLKKLGIKAVAIHSGLSRFEVDVALDNCIYGDYKLLYLSPERLGTELFLSRLDNINVNLIAVDEAHCISQWGYDFRPSYLRIAEIRDRLPGVPVLALTATATPEVVDDIQDKLRFSKHNVIRQTFERKNLAYVVRQTEDKASSLLRILNKQQGSGIVYARSRKRVEEIAALLLKNGISAGYYHAGLDVRKRTGLQHEWMHDKLRIMVATNAFGMGIDKENVRLVVHYELPNSPEAYFQEAGRAGRDGRKAYAVLLYHPSDHQSLEKAHTLRFPDVEMIRRVYQALGNFYQIIPGSGKGQAFNFNLKDFCSKFGFHTLAAYHALKHLERSGYIELTDEINLPSRIHFRITRDDLYKFQVANDRFDAVIRLILRTYPGLFSEFGRIDEETLAKKAKVRTGLIIQVLENLRNLGVIYYLKPQSNPQIIFTSERLENQSLLFPEKSYQQRKEAEKKRMNVMWHYASSDTRCRSQQLLLYFGEKDPFRCGQCDVCLRKHETGLSQYEADKIIHIIYETLKQGPVDQQELIELTHSDPSKAATIISYLTDRGFIAIRKGKVQMINPKTVQGEFF
ncbi:MAG: RecQ family ATP-dependent DNA helicase [Bacteroidales bacterium]|nr:RecQ family ATP-dependent DNA helicase [Bacteroidales bacterium]